MTPTISIASLAVPGMIVSNPEYRYVGHSTSRHLEDLDRLCSLDDPNRRRLYHYVVAQQHPVSRDEASTALDIDRSTAAYHLDRLVDRGLLAASFARPEGRSGPGAGRPAKHYERADVEITVAIPPRDYRLLAELLAHAIDTGGHATVTEALTDAAHSHGAALAEGDTGQRTCESCSTARDSSPTTTVMPSGFETVPSIGSLGSTPTSSAA